MFLRDDLKAQQTAARVHRAERDLRCFEQAAHAVEHAEDAAAIAAQVNDDARRVAHRAQGSAELSQDRNGKKIKAYVTDVLSQSPRFKLDKERRERLHGRRHLAFESLASDAHAMH